ncbi:glycosyltransferase family 4 protein [Rathayibacter sp. SD072]|uniref:glycosyltransferase family 4 protein n=1 Tax=Rathayibacter sp. SD072 TaxID=2781731 RepID=UPI0027DA22B0|nr:glycosyltransferase family 4 protein [Rathayibacter sp. SD072]
MPRPDRDIDVLFVVNYYAPYVSGLTDVVRMVAESLAAEGVRVAVVAQKHDDSLPSQEVIAGVEVRRCAVQVRIGKGLLSASFPVVAARYARRSRVVNMHLPMLESGVITAVVRTGTPVVSTYHCDVTLGAGAFDRFQMAAMDASCRAAIRLSAATIVTTLDYASRSRLAATLQRGRLEEIPPPTRDRTGGSAAFRTGAGLHVGFLGRIVEEKGIGYLVDGFRALDDPDARLLIGGDFAAVAGGSVIEEVRRRIGGDDRISVLGFVAEESIPDFYASLDVFALPSINALEAFGIVQVEAMRAGAPAIASDLPGVRTPVQRTGFGRIVPRRDAQAITRALESIREDGLDRVEGARIAEELYSRETVVAQYRELFESVSLESNGSTTST